MEFWRTARSLPLRSARIAQRAESEGWAGVTFSDSQNLSGDPYTALATAAARTTTIRLATGVTNPWTRHPAVTASAISCVDIESGGRAELGIGRGDSALAYVGLPPASTARFTEYLELLTAYIRGDSVPVQRAAAIGASLTAAAVPLGNAPETARLQWLDDYGDRQPVPVFVTASGPKVIEISARRTDRVALAVGADPERVKWAIDLARAARPDVKIAAYVNVVVHDDPEKARQMAAGTIASFARFSAMHGKLTGPSTEAQREVFEAIPRQYEMTRHVQNAGQATLVSTEFAQRYAILGPPQRCIDRLAELAALGVDRFHIVGTARDVSREDALATHEAFVQSVLSSLSSE
jgi:5,10-methylenetetrahydromethanopterin reductase